MRESVFRIHREKVERRKKRLGGVGRSRALIWDFSAWAVPISPFGAGEAEYSLSAVGPIRQARVIGAGPADR